MSQKGEGKTRTKKQKKVTGDDEKSGKYVTRLPWASCAKGN